MEPKPEPHLSDSFQNPNPNCTPSDSTDNHIDENVELDYMDPDSLAIVPVIEDDNNNNNNNNNNQLTAVECSFRRKPPPRSGELVRVSGLEIEDERYFRELVRKTRILYDSLWVNYMMEDRNPLTGRAVRARADMKAASEMRKRGLWLNQDKRIVGPIPGINVGDVFFFRMELCVLGVHGQVQAGIDYLSSKMSANGEPIATSVIVSGGYEDDEDSGEVIVYTGQGGQDKNSRQVFHQRLETGNLGLERSMHHEVEVRVVRGVKYKGGNGTGDKVYVYDGVYKIEEYWFEVGKSGFGVYKFKLVRMEGQPEMGSAVLKFAESVKANPMVARPVGYVSLDISRKKENVPVFLFNDIDDNHEPLDYDYQVTTIFPTLVYQNERNSGGCDCVNGCALDCACARKNGGEFVYDSNGRLLKGKPVIFECGPFCSCPPNCINQVSQKGVRHNFEIFRSVETGWGVRSLDLIQAGSFICEYTGVVLTKNQAQVFTMNGEDSLVYPYRFGERWAEWGDFSQVISEYSRPSYPSIPPLDFAVDVSKMRNVACYMSHSPCPNVFVQLVMYDHNNIAYPHLMLFAMENIPPLRELSLDYDAAGEWSEKLAICN